MFRCTNCKKSPSPRVKPTIVPVEERVRQYHFYDNENNPKVMSGTEIVREAMLCPKCAGIKPVSAVTDTSASVTLGLTLQGHARKCNKKLDECLVCQRAVRDLYPGLPTPVTNKITRDVQVHTGRVSVCELALGSMVRRTIEQVRDGKQGRRARADFQAALSVLKGYESRGGTL